MKAMLANDPTTASQTGGFLIPEGLQVGASLLQRRLQQLQADPSEQPWLQRAIVL